MSIGRNHPSDSNRRDADADYLEALVAERHLYLAVGNTERAALVTAELDRLGHRSQTGAKETAVSEPALETTQGEKPAGEPAETPKKRTPRKQSTAD